MMATNIPPEQFTQIMLLPTHLRRDLLEFLGYASVGKEELEKIIADLESRVKPPAADTSH